MLKKTLLSLISIGIINISDADNLPKHLVEVNSNQVRQHKDLWSRMRAGFMLNHKHTQEVKNWEKRYSAPKYFNIIMQNAGPYLYFIITELERRGLPTELALIPIVESTYNPNAVSPAAISTGMWQFIASSGARFNLQQNAEIDERKDIVKSTRAAIDYLQYMYALFGNWELTIAAYNLGEGAIYRATLAAKSKNFYDLKVRDITRQYVPKIIALSNIIKNPSRFGIQLTQLPNTANFAIINPEQRLKGSEFIKYANLSVPEFKKYNPQYHSLNRSLNSSQKLVLPIKNHSNYYAALGKEISYPVSISPENNQFAASQNERMITNETSLSSEDPIGVLIAASENKTQPIAVSDNNDMVAIANSNTTEGSRQEIDDLIATLASDDINNPQDQTKAIKFMAKATNYTVNKGDTLHSIARKFSVSIDSIKASNQLANNIVKLNQKLIIELNE